AKALDVSLGMAVFGDDIARVERALQKPGGGFRHLPAGLADRNHERLSARGRKAGKRAAHGRVRQRFCDDLPGDRAQFLFQRHVSSPFRWAVPRAVLRGRREKRPARGRASGRWAQANVEAASMACTLSQSKPVKAMMLKSSAPRT